VPYRPTTNGSAESKWPLRIALGATAAIAALRAWIGTGVTFCGTPDSCAYLALGESLSQHRGFFQNFVLQYQMSPPLPPTHGIEYWRPGTSFLLLFAQPFGGVSLHSSIVVTMLAGILLASVAWRVAMDATGDSQVACASYLLCLVLPPMWAGSAAPDSALFYAAFAAWSLALFTVRSPRPWKDCLAWACLLVVNLIRNDAILLLAPLLVVLWLRRRSGAQSGSSSAYTGAAILAFFVALLPMNAINYAVLRKASTGSASQALYLVNLGEMLNYNQPSTFHTMMAAGLLQLIKIRAVALPTIIYRAFFLLLGFGAIFLFVQFRRKNNDTHQTVPELAGGVTLAVVIVATYGLVLPAIGTFSALRSLCALLPLEACTMVSGMLWCCATRKLAFRMAGVVIFFYLIAGILGVRRSIDDANRLRENDDLVASYLSAHGGNLAHDSLVMTADSAQFSVTTSYPSVPVPSNGTAAIVESIRDLRPNYVLLDEDQMQQIGTVLVPLVKPQAVGLVPHTHVIVLTMPATRN
jgi:hypothetical protein